MKTVWKVVWVVLVVGPGLGRAQYQPPLNQINPNRTSDEVDIRGGGDSAFNHELLVRQMRRLRELHQHEVISDTARMEQLAAAMKDEVDKGNKTLNADVMKDADEISKLAKRVSDRIKSQ